MRPHLNGHSEYDTFEHARLDESSKRADGLFALEAQGLLDFLVFGENLGMIDITVAVKRSQDAECLFPPIFAGKPTGRLGEEEHAGQQNRRGDHLHAPRDPEGCRTLARVGGTTAGEGRAILDEILDENTPRDGPLLEGNDPTADLLGCYFGLVDRYDGRCNSDTDTGDDPTDDQECNAIRRCL